MPFENVILLAEKGGVESNVLLTASVGRGCRNIKTCTAPYSTVIEDRSGDHVVRLTTSPLEQEIVKTLDRLPHRFRDLGFGISTGPVVTFRATRFLRRRRSSNTAPLFWMHNVRPFLIQKPLANGKPAHILVSDQSRRLVVPAKRYLLLKRFTAKEEKRRLVAAIMEPSDSYSEWVGLENHLNYVYRAQAELSKFEALGLAAYLNAALVDRYFRAISGSTQVNAAEIRTLPTPDEHLLVQIGKEIERTSQRNHAIIEGIVCSALHLPVQLIKKLGSVQR